MGRTEFRLVLYPLTTSKQTQRYNKAVGRVVVEYVRVLSLLEKLWEGPVSSTRLRPGNRTLSGHFCDSSLYNSVCRFRSGPDQENRGHGTRERIWYKEVQGLCCPKKV